MPAAAVVVRHPLTSPWRRPATLARHNCPPTLGGWPLGEQWSCTASVLLAAFEALLHRYSDQDDVRVATHLANRYRPGTESLIGPVVNTVILRTNLGGDPTCREALRRVRETTLAAFANQDVRFAEVVATLQRERTLKPAGLAQAMMWLQNPEVRPTTSSGQHHLTFEEAAPGMLLPMVTITTFDVTLMLRESTRGLVGTCVYKPDLFGARTMACLLRDFRQVLVHMVLHPERPISALPVPASLNQQTSAG